MPKILVCDDDQDIVSALRIYLEAENYEVVSASNGLEALSALRNDDEIALVLLDIMMPELDGISTLARLREEKNLPVILLTAKSEDTDKVLGLNVGADDYVTKPFNPVELSARVRSQLRRYLQLGGSEQKTETLRVGAVSLDDRCKEVRVDGDLINLTPREYEILKLLMQHAGEVFRPEEIYRRVWQDEPYGSEGTVAVHIRKLREKTEITPAEPRYLKTVWGQGYKFEAAERRREP
jgi:DNA-binding response OmpR family regulator